MADPTTPGPDETNQAEPDPQPFSEPNPSENANPPRPLSADELAQQLRQVHDPDLDAAMDAIIDAAPPLTDEARSRLAMLFARPSRQPRRAA